jgi:archaeosine synthase
MTEYFEVLERDAAARIAQLRLDEPLTTPALVDDVVEDAGSLWPEDRELPAGSDDRLTILPHRGFPSGTAEEVKESFAVDYPDVDYPSAVVVDPDTAANFGADAYVLSGTQNIVGHGRAFRDAVIATREAIPADSGLYLSGVATPANAATLAYAGVDLLDADRAWVRGLEGFYLTTDGERFLEDLADGLPCPCPVCSSARDGRIDREACAEHNVRALAAELTRVRTRIRDARLRDYLEGQARHEAWATATMRRLDDRWGYLEPRTHVARDAELRAATDDSLRRVTIRRFADRATARYRDRLAGDRPLVIVPCSARKPYGDSRSHGQYRDAIGYRAHKLSMTSPIGVVPQELEWTYPAQHYDAVVTGRWTETELEFVADVLARYLDGAGAYGRIVAHVPETGYREVVERALARARATPAVEFTVGDHPTTDASLSALSSALAGEPSHTKRERQHATVRAIADYQFGASAGGGERERDGGTGPAGAETGSAGADGGTGGADAAIGSAHARGVGDRLFDDVRTDGRLPSIRVLAGPESAADVEPGTQLAAVVPQYGTLALTLAGARRLRALDRAGVLSAPLGRIDGFVPEGSVLAPGVTAAPDHVRPGDELVFEGPQAFGVGRALMSGPEMARSTRGIAVQVRHVEERP